MTYEPLKRAECDVCNGSGVQKVKTLHLSARRDAYAPLAIKKCPACQGRGWVVEKPR